MPHEFDVVVVGSGIAGLSSAISALESGARVAVLERVHARGERRQHPLHRGVPAHGVDRRGRRPTSRTGCSATTWATPTPACSQDAVNDRSSWSSADAHARRRSTATSCCASPSEAPADAAVAHRARHGASTPCRRRSSPSRRRACRRSAAAGSSWRRCPRGQGARRDVLLRDDGALASCRTTRARWSACAPRRTASITRPRGARLRRLRGQHRDARPLHGTAALNTAPGRARRPLQQGRGHRDGPRDRRAPARATSAASTPSRSTRAPAWPRPRSSRSPTASW